MTQELSIVSPAVWTGFIIAILILLIVDLVIFGRQKKVSKKHALMESGMWIGIALLFNLWFGYQYGTVPATEFLTGYLVEKTLSIDNLFIILLVFSAFRISSQHQHRILFFGVLGAILMRAIFILIGAQLLHAFSWILYVFGAILIFTAVKFLRESDEKKDVRENIAVRLIRKIIPVTEKFDGDKFFIRENGILMATPMFLALIVIEFTDLVFAVDSIPAVFAVTQDAFIAFASNILAVLGLRSLYFVLADWVSELRYLKPGLAAILGFIGIKMLLLEVYKIPGIVSLVVIFFILVTAALSSWNVNHLEKRKQLQE